MARVTVIVLVGELLIMNTDQPLCSNLGPIRVVDRKLSCEWSHARGYHTLNTAKLLIPGTRSTCQDGYLVEHGVGVFPDFIEYMIGAELMITAEVKTSSSLVSRNTFHRQFSEGIYLP